MYFSGHLAPFPRGDSKAELSPDSDGIESPVHPDLVFGNKRSREERDKSYITLRDDFGNPILCPNPATYLGSAIAPTERPQKRARVEGGNSASVSASASASASSSSSSPLAAFSGPPFSSAFSLFDYQDESKYRITRAAALKAYHEEEAREFKAREEISRLAAEQRRQQLGKHASKKLLDEEPKFPFGSKLQRLLKHHLDSEKSAAEAGKLIPMRKACFDPDAAKRVTGEIRYRSVLAKIEQITEANGFMLEAAQRTFVTEYLKACAPLIYGSDWDRSALRFLEKNRISKINYQVMALTPRRFGKTWSICVFVLGLLLCVPGIKVAVISQNLRTSVALVKIMMSFLFMLPDGKDRLASNSTVKIEIIPEEDASKNLTMSQKRNHPKLSSVVALPSTADGKYAARRGFLLFVHRNPRERERERERKELQNCKVN